jgi:hypothetical protein
MFVTKVTDNGKVIGYNVTISLCEVPNAYLGLPALVSDDRTLTGFQAPGGIVLAEAKDCGYGEIAFANNTTLLSQKSISNPETTADFPVNTSFAQPRRCYY